MSERLSELLVRFRRGLCRRCIIRLTGSSPEEIERALSDLARAVRLTDEERRCPTCHRRATVVRFAAGD
jgi:uncharacterized protein with PIN domain